MLIDFENVGYIKVCDHPDVIPVENNNSFIPASTWGYIRGDISEQSDLLKLFANIESGLTPEQIELLSRAEDIIGDVEDGILDLSKEFDSKIEGLTLVLEKKADVDSVYTKSEIDNKGYLTEHQSLAGYATESWVYSKEYISSETDPIWSSEKHKYALKAELPSVAGLASESLVYNLLTTKANVADVYTKSEVDAAISNVEVNVDLSDYYTKSEIDEVISNIEIGDIDLTGYAKESWVKEQGYLTEHQSLADYYTKSEVDSAISNIEINADLTGYATENWVKEQGYLTEHQSLDNYYTKSEVDTAISNAEVDLTGYATESYVDAAVENKVSVSDIWTGTQDEWDALTPIQQSSYIIAMIEL